MKKSEKTLKSEERKLQKLRAQTEDLRKKSEVAKTELDAAKVSFGKQAIAGDDVGTLSGELSLKQNAIDILKSGLQELASQVASQEGVVAQAAQACYQDESVSLVDSLLKDSVELIEQFAKAQVVVHRNLVRTQRLNSLRTNHRVRNVLHNIDFEALANELQSAQSILEREIRVKEASKVPSAMARGGYIDETNRQKTLGSQVRDWAAAQVTGN